MNESWDEQKLRLNRLSGQDGPAFLAVHADREAIVASLTRHEADEKRIGELKVESARMHKWQGLAGQRADAAEARVAELEAELDRLKALNADRGELYKQLFDERAEFRKAEALVTELREALFKLTEHADWLDGAVSRKDKETRKFFAEFYADVQKARAALARAKEAEREK